MNNDGRIHGEQLLLNFDQRLPAHEVPQVRPVRTWAPCGCCFVGELPFWPGNQEKKRDWYRKQWSARRCTVPGYADHKPEKSIHLSFERAIDELFEFVHKEILDAIREAEVEPAQRSLKVPGVESLSTQELLDAERRRMQDRNKPTYSIEYRAAQGKGA